MMDTVPVRYLASQATGGDNSERRASVQRCTGVAARTAGWPEGIQSSRSPGTAPKHQHSLSSDTYRNLTAPYGVSDTNPYCMN